MDTSTYVPTPWTVGDSGIVYDDNAYEVAIPIGRDETEKAYIARLIAAAPDLLAALENVLAGAEDHGLFNGTSYDPDYYLDEIRAAIAKATS